MSELVFITAEVCPFAQRTHLALREKGLAYDHREVDLSNKPAWFEAVSPYSKVPVLKHGDVVVYESAIINEYLDEAFPEPPLMPRDAAHRAYARVWIDFANSRLVPSFYKVLTAKTAAEQEAEAEKLVGHLRFVETEGLAKLGADPYWLGREVSLVDLAFYPHFERFPALAHYRGIDIPAECGRIRACSPRWPSARASAPPATPTTTTSNPTSVTPAPPDRPRRIRTPRR